LTVLKLEVEVLKSNRILFQFVTRPKELYAVLIN
jgi:hypothetical protein